jgi:dUTP pyrophosphatase
MPTLKIYRQAKRLSLPAYQYEGDAGLDLPIDTTDEPGEVIILRPKTPTKVSTGMIVELPPGHVGLVCPRSGLASRQGITVANAPGVIDPSFRGLLQVILINHGSSNQLLKHGDRIAQLVVVPFAKMEVREVQWHEITKSDRGDKGFGSSGV